MTLTLQFGNNFHHSGPGECLLLYGHTARSSVYRGGIYASLELSPELELDAAGSAGAGRAGVQDSGDPAETGRRLDREGRPAAAHRADAGARIQEFRVVQQVEGGRSEVQGHTLRNMEALLQGRVYFKSAWSVGNVAAEIAPTAVGRRSECSRVKPVRNRLVDGIDWHTRHQVRPLPGSVSIQHCRRRPRHGDIHRKPRAGADDTSQFPSPDEVRQCAAAVQELLALAEGQ